MSLEPDPRAASASDTIQATSEVLRNHGSHLHPHVITEEASAVPLQPVALSSSFTTAQLYQTLPLDRESRLIRILDLCPKKRSHDGSSLTGHLRLVSLKTCPAFNALSYVWGTSGVDDESMQHTIMCNGCAIPITRNCYLALSALQKVHANISIWVDSICINQKDRQEKEVQIPLMEEIYTWARTVYIWMGPGSEATDRAIARLKFSQSRGAPTSPGTPWYDGRIVMTIHQEQLSLYCRLPFRYIHFAFATILIFLEYTIFGSWLTGVLAKVRKNCSLSPQVGLHGASADDISELLNINWLSRSWTFQEFVLASNPVFICGQRRIALTQLRSGLRFPLNDNRYRQSQQSHKLSQLQLHLPSTLLAISERDSVMESATLDRWTALFSAWDQIKRPLKWNNKRFRRIKDPYVGPKRPRISWSVSHYQRYAFDQKKIFTSAIQFGLLLALSMCITLIIVIYEYSKTSSYLIWIVLLLLFLPMAALILVDWWNMQYSASKASLWPTSEDEDALQAVIQALRERQSHKPHDRAYALGGVLWRFGVRLPPPDYRKSSKEVYKELFSSLIAWRPSLINLLLDVGPLEPDVPSWVPDWSHVQERSWLDPTYIYTQAQGTSYDTRSVTVSGDTIVLRGILLGTITTCSGALQSIRAESQTAETLSAAVSLHRWLAAVKNDMPINSRHTLPSAVLEVINGHKYQQSQANRDLDTEDKIAQTFRSWYHFMNEYLDLYRGRQGAARRQEMIDDMLVKLERDQAALSFIRLVCEKFGGRRGLFFSLDGFMGSGPPQMDAGDKMVILDGVSVPMILRQDLENESQFRVIGPCFMHGLMDEEERRVLLESRESAGWSSIILV